MMQGTKSQYSDNPEEWGREGAGRDIQEEGDICMPNADSC